MQLLTLDCGRQVWLVASASNRTYGDHLDGRLNAAMSGRMARETKPEIDEPWTTSPTATPKTN